LDRRRRCHVLDDSFVKTLSKLRIISSRLDERIDRIVSKDSELCVVKGQVELNLKGKLVCNTHKFRWTLEQISSSGWESFLVQNHQNEILAKFSEVSMHSEPGLMYFLKVWETFHNKVFTELIKNAAAHYSELYDSDIFHCLSIGPCTSFHYWIPDSSLNDEHQSGIPVLKVWNGNRLFVQVSFGISELSKDVHGIGNNFRDMFGRILIWHGNHKLRKLLRFYLSAQSLHGTFWHALELISSSRDYQECIAFAQSSLSLRFTFIHHGFIEISFSLKTGLFFVSNSKMLQYPGSTFFTHIGQFEECLNSSPTKSLLQLKYFHRSAILERIIRYSQILGFSVYKRAPFETCMEISKLVSIRNSCHIADKHLLEKQVL